MTHVYACQITFKYKWNFFKKMRRQISRKLDWLKINQLDITEVLTIQEKWEYTDKTGCNFLNFTVHIRPYCDSNYVNWQIQFSINLSQNFRNIDTAFIRFLNIFFFYFHQATFPFYKMFHYPNFHDISPFSASIPIQRIFCISPLIPILGEVLSIWTKGGERVQLPQGW